MKEWRKKPVLDSLSSRRDGTWQNEPNKIAFAQFLESCLHTTNPDQLIREIDKLDSCRVKGLGPAVANPASTFQHCNSPGL